MSDWLITGALILALGVVTLAARPIGYWLADREKRRRTDG